MRTLVIFLILSTALLCGRTAPLSPSIVTKLLTLLNSVKAALPKSDSLPGGDKSSEGGGKSEKKAGQPTHFQMDDRSPEIEVKTSDQGVDIKTKPASLQVESNPQQIKTIENDERALLGQQQQQTYYERLPLAQRPQQTFLAPPPVEHIIQPIFYGGDMHPDYHFYHHYHHHHHYPPYHPYIYYPYRHFHRHEYMDDEDEEGDKKGHILQAGDEKKHTKFLKKKITKFR